VQPGGLGGGGAGEKFRGLAPAGEKAKGEKTGEYQDVEPGVGTGQSTKRGAFPTGRAGAPVF